MMSLNKDVLRRWLIVPALAALPLSLAVAPLPARAPAAAPSPLKGPAVYELRTYYTNPGKLETLKTRFRDHALKLFKKHGMTPVAFWVKDGGEGILVYILAYPSMAAREASWAAFRADPEWVAASAASEVNGKLLAKVDSSFMTMTDFSPHPKSPAGDVFE